ncbi:MAG: hotdog fold thioesterase [Alphaproteobacteria bacterium]|nr:hotdog fold thioesterase [Alphaproteobacteria bacterium]
MTDRAATDTGADDPQARALKDAMAAINPVYRWLGIEIEVAGTASARFAMDVKEQHANTFGVCHGGIVFAFADLALGFTCNARGERAATASASIEFLKPVPLGDRLVGDVICTALSGRNAYYDVVLSLASAPGVTVGLVRGRMRLTGGPTLAT